MGVFNTATRKNGAVGNLVARSSDSVPNGLGLMPNATKYPASTDGVRARYISGCESLMGGRSRNHGCRMLENI
ncbi:hypothetical protein TNCV_1826081 [Trichonephila clavipes]|nr:hypothetical protein TNCV_1826081 [Trichonephila clavipes]